MIKKIKEKILNFAKEYKMYVILILIILINFLFYNFSFKLDLTAKNTYTLSNVTKQKLKKLDDIVNIKVYASEDLPAQYLQIKQYLRDILRDYQFMSSGKVRVKWIDPSEDEEIIQEAQRLGIPQLQFSDIQQDQFQVTKGFLGVAIVYEDQAETIPLVESTRDLEYQLTSKIYKLVRDKEPQLAFTTEHGEKTTAVMQQSQNMPQQILAKETLSEEFSVSDFAIASGSANLIPDKYNGLVVLGPNKEFDSHGKYVLDQFLMQGKPITFLLDSIEVSNNLQSSNANHGLYELLKNYGIELKKSLVLDRTNEVANFNAGQTMFLTPYPYWVKAVSQNLNKEHPVTQGIQQLVLPWVSPLEFDQNDSRIKPLVYSSENSWEKSETPSLNPSQNFQPKAEGRKPLGVVLEGKLNSFFSNKEKPEGFKNEVIKETEKGKLAVIGDADFINAGIAQRYSQNVHFFVNLVEYLTLGEGLSEIRVKSDDIRPLIELSDTKRQTYKYANMLGMPILVGMIGFVYLYYQNKKEYHL